MTNRASFLALILALIPLHLGADAWMPVAPHMLRADAPDRSTLALRILAEIDGDAATFTDEERRKLTVLAQVMGAANVDPWHGPTRVLPHFGS